MKYILIQIGLILSLSLVLVPPVFSVQRKPDGLEFTELDPLLPSNPTVPLTFEEQQELIKRLDLLNQEATAKLEQGNKSEAFEIWNRYLRLCRALGLVAEIEGLARVGEIAWENNETESIRIITRRLQEIETGIRTQKPITRRDRKYYPPSEVPEANMIYPLVAKAYQNMRLPEPAIAIYQILLTEAKQQGDLTTTETILQAIGTLQLIWFKYPEAAKTYEELLVLAQTKRDTIVELQYIKQLEEIYKQIDNPKIRLANNLKLAEKYKNESDQLLLPPVLLAIAADYERINEPDKAREYYEAAYNLSWKLEQFGRTGEALNKLGSLYLKYNQPTSALEIYQILVQVEMQSYNYYGLMSAYDKMGEIYLAQKNYPLALSLFQKALELSKTINHQQAHFENQINRVNQAQR